LENDICNQSPTIQCRSFVFPLLFVFVAVSNESCYHSAIPFEQDYDLNGCYENTQLNMPTTNPANAFVVSAVGGLAVLATELSKNRNNIFAHSDLKTQLYTCESGSVLATKSKKVSLAMDHLLKMSVSTVLEGTNIDESSIHSLSPFEAVITTSSMIDHFLSHSPVSGATGTISPASHCREIPSASKLLMHHMKDSHQKRHSFLVPSCSFLKWRMIEVDNFGKRKSADIEIEESFARSILGDRIKTKSNVNMLLKGTCHE